jgi:hypothetical protein
MNPNRMRSKPMRFRTTEAVYNFLGIAQKPVRKLYLRKSICFVRKLDAELPNAMTPNLPTLALAGLNATKAKRGRK